MGRYIEYKQQKKALLAIVILDRVDFKRSIIVDKQRYFIMIYVKLP